jgi:hypothetical protein
VPREPPRRCLDDVAALNCRWRSDDRLWGLVLFGLLAHSWTSSAWSALRDGIDFVVGLTAVGIANIHVDPDEHPRAGTDRVGEGV